MAPVQSWHNFDQSAIQLVRSRRCDCQLCFQFASRYCSESAGTLGSPVTGFGSWSLCEGYIFKLFFTQYCTMCHRRTSQARWGAGLQPPYSGETVIFRVKAKFFGQKPAAKNEKKYFFAFIKRTNGIPSVYDMKCPKSGIFTKLLRGVNSAK